MREKLCSCIFLRVCSDYNSKELNSSEVTGGGSRECLGGRFDIGFIGMNKQQNRKLAKLIRDQINESNSFQLLNQWELVNNTLERFHGWAKNKHCHCAYLIGDGNTKYWFLFIKWQPNKYYLVIYPEDRTVALAEIHKVSKQKNGSEFEWQYRPSKQDNNNDLRRNRFKQLEGTLTVRIALPDGEVTLDDFLGNVFNVVDSRQKADDLDEDIRGLESSEFPEGKRIEKIHKARERNRKVVQKAKQEHARKNKGNLPCEVCGFDFGKKYGKEIGDFFLEAHHKIPLCKLDELQGTQTTVSDLAMVCANCHRMLHRSPVSIQELSRIVKRRRK